MLPFTLQPQPPPRGVPLVSSSFAARYMSASPTRRAELWTEWCRVHSVPTTTQVDTDVRVTAPSPAPPPTVPASPSASPPPALFYWILEVGNGVRYYALPMPLSPHAVAAAYTTPSPYWVPLRLLRYLPHFPIPVPVDLDHHRQYTGFYDDLYGEDAVNAWEDEAGGFDSLDPPPAPHLVVNHAVAIRNSDTAARSATSVALYSAQGQRDAFLKPLVTRAWQTRCARFWNRRPDPTEDLPFDCYFPTESYEYLRFCTRDVFLTRARQSPSTRTRRSPIGQRGAEVARRQYERRQEWLRRRRAQKLNELASSLGDGDGEAEHGRTVTMTDAEDAQREKALSYRSVISYANVVNFCGVGYINVADTRLRCLFDSTTCTRHAVPLNEYGEVFFAAMDAVRARLQPRLNLTKPAPLPQPVGRRNKGFLPYYDAAARMVATAAGTESAASSSSSRQEPSSMWVERIRALRNSFTATGLSHFATPRERAMDAKTRERYNGFLFSSPYWVAVDTLQERWGVVPVKGATPIFVGNRAYINAEQTTNAALFSSVTCTPRRQQQVLARDYHAYCSWKLSEALAAVALRTESRSSVYPDTDPLLASHVSTPSYSPTSSQEAAPSTSAQAIRAHAQRLAGVCNLWITVDVVRAAGWTLTKDAVVAHVPEDDVLPRWSVSHSQHTATASTTVSVSENSLLGTAPDHWPAPVSVLGVHAHTVVPRDHPGFASASMASAPLCIVNASAVVERDELLFVLSYRPRIFLGCVTPMTKDDPGYEAYAAALVKRNAHKDTSHPPSPNPNSAEAGDRGAQPTEDVSDEDDDDDDDGHATRTDSMEEEADTARDVFTASLESEADDAEATTQTATSVPTKRYVKRLRARVLRGKRQKLAAAWGNRRLPLSSRLEMALLALQRRYPVEARSRWVTIDFLRHERNVQPVEECPTVLEVTFLVGCTNAADTPSTSSRSPFAPLQTGTPPSVTFATTHVLNVAELKGFTEQTSAARDHWVYKDV